MWNVVQRLREICNEPVSTSSKSSSLSCSLPDWCYLDKHQSSHWSNIKKYDPLENISLDQINLVFLSQEVTTTGNHQTRDGNRIFWKGKVNTLCKCIRGQTSILNKQGLIDLWIFPVNLANLDQGAGNYYVHGNQLLDLHVKV